MFKKIIVFSVILAIPTLQANVFSNALNKIEAELNESEQRAIIKKYAYFLIKYKEIITRLNNHIAGTECMQESACGGYHVYDIDIPSAKKRTCVELNNLLQEITSAKIESESIQTLIVTIQKRIRELKTA